METIVAPYKTILQELGEGLILRRATEEDAKALSEFNARVHSEDGPERPAEDVAAWTRDLLLKPHPSFNPGDFTLVEDTRTGKIVSSMNLISQTWTYAGIPFGVGRPELVGTQPEYRNRGLVRAQFDVVHQWSAERGELVQAITGIPYYYRQFGYEMGLELAGGRAGFAPQVPKLKKDEQEPYRLRPAEVSDLDFILQMHQQTCSRCLVCSPWGEDLWRYELTGKSQKNNTRLELRVIETPEGEPVGLLGHNHYRWGALMAAVIYEVKPGVSWAAVTPTVIRYLWATGGTTKPESGNDEFTAFGFWMGSQHPVYQVLGDQLPRVRKPYSWYVRVPDLSGFLRHIAPVLEERLAASPLNGHTGELRITFYRSGLRLRIEKGKLVEAEPWRPQPQGHSGDAGFPDLTFLRLLFGQNSLTEIKDMFADCWWDKAEFQVLLEILFPKAYSAVWGVT
jgi:hypothetical protein